MLRRGWIVGVLLAGGILSARAEDAITLKVTDTLPTTHYISIEGVQFMMHRVTELTHDRVKFQYYPAEQLGKPRDMLRLVQSGVADIAYIVPSYISEKMPLSAVSELPLLVTSACQGTRAFEAVAHGDILPKREFQPNGIVPLMTVNIGPYAISSRTPDMHALEDFKGMKIRGPGGTWDLVLRAIGAVPVNLPAPDTRQALERGTIDAFVGPAISLKPYDLLTAAHSMTHGVSFGSLALTFSISAKRFNALPQDVQAAFVTAGKEADAHLCSYIDAHEAQAFDEARKTGVKIWDISSSDQTTLQAMLQPVIKQWSDALDRRQLPGTAVVQAFEAAIK